VVLVLTPTFVSAQLCHFGDCLSPDGGSCPNYCGRFTQLQDTYYDPECYQNGSGTCYQYICWYMDDSSSSCNFPNDVCDNDDYYTCQYEGG
jgi:hypothetical protein